MWGFSDCMKPRRLDLNYTITNGAASWRWTRRGFQLSYFATAVLTVALTVGVELTEAWQEIGGTLLIL